MLFDSTICNDYKIGNYVSIMSGTSVSEHSEIWDESFLSAGCTIYPHKDLGCYVAVGVEATASRDYGNNTKVNEKGAGLSLFK